LDPHWKALGCRTTSSPKMWMDAFLAALAIAGGHQLVTIDKDFQQFPNLDCILLSKVANQPQSNAAGSTDKA
jgi:predicted nucleic acid-binding protein